jgi:hypothetical protein
MAVIINNAVFWDVVPCGFDIVFQGKLKSLLNVLLARAFLKDLKSYINLMV